jgi:hypothetical protein
MARGPVRSRAAEIAAAVRQGLQRERGDPAQNPNPAQSRATPRNQRKTRGAAGAPRDRPVISPAMMKGKRKMKDLLTARREAGTPRGIEYASRLAAMPPAEAATEIYDMFELAADEDVAGEMILDLQIHPHAAERIAVAVMRKRYAERGNGDLTGASDGEILQMLHESAARDRFAALEWGKGADAGTQTDFPSWIPSRC